MNGHERTPPPEFLPLLRRAGLAGSSETPKFSPLPGGVSSDIWVVGLERGPVCIKQALARLKVPGDWRAPVARNAYEVAWMQTVAGIEPNCVPPVLHHDAETGSFVMPYLDPADFLSWKEELRLGRADTAVAAEVGRILARIHDATAHRDDIAGRCPTDDIFHAIRLDPYLEATATRHPRLAPRLLELSETTAGCRQALVHGDVSPKNILIGPDGPVFLDAECAWYGDPAFDVAFCLNHFLLKCLWTPAAAAGFLRCFEAMREAYVGALSKLDAEALEGRAAGLLPGLLLARVDGKSPVEYVTNEADRDFVRTVAAGLLNERPVRLGDVAAAWRDAFGERPDQ